MTRTPSETRVSGFRSRLVPEARLDRSQSTFLQLLTTPEAPKTASGVPYYGYRFYAPELGRWINRDPIEEEGGLNLYISCQNRSIYWIDPDGKKSRSTVTGYADLDITKNRVALSENVQKCLKAYVKGDLTEYSLNCVKDCVNAFFDKKPARFAACLAKCAGIASGKDLVCCLSTMKRMQTDPPFRGLSKCDHEYCVCMLSVSKWNIIRAIIEKNDCRCKLMECELDVLF